MNNLYNNHQFSLNKLSGLLGLDLKYFIGGGIWLLLPFGINILLGIIRSIFFARLLQQSVYGQFTFVNATMGTLAILSLPGINIALVETVARGNWGSMIDGARARAIFGFLGTIGMTAVSLYFYMQGEDQLVLALLISGVFLPFNSAFQVAQAYHNGRKQIKIVGLMQTGIMSLSTILLILVLLVEGGLIWLVLVDSLSKLVFYSIFYLKARKEVIGTPRDPEVVTYGRNLTGAQAIESIATYLDNVILGFSVGFVDVAIYRIASVFPKNYNSLTKIASTLTIPKIAEHPNKQIYTNRVRRQLSVLQIINLILVMIIIILIQIFIPIFYGDIYSESIFFAQLLMVSLIFALPDAFFVAALQSRKQTKSIAQGNIISGVLLIAFLLILVPSIGIIGIIISRIISRWSSSFYRFYKVSKI